MWEAVQMLQAVLNSVDAAILMVDMDFQVVLCNSKFGDFFGLDPVSLIGEDKRAAITRDIKWRVKNPEEFQKRLFWLYENPEVTANDEVEVSLPRRRVLHRFSGPVYDKDQVMLGRVEVYTDITEAKNLQHELEIKNSQLYMLNAAATAINDTLDLDHLSKRFLQRIRMVTNAQAGVLYVKQGKSLKLKATTGTFSNVDNIPKLVSPNLLKKPFFWGSDLERTPPKPLSAILEGSFYIGFPARHQEEVNGLCILIWDTSVPGWCDESSFENIGIQLGIGIHNAFLHQEVRQASPKKKTVSLDLHLSPREIQVLNSMASGMTNKEIASHLGISEYTVKNHVRSILGKMGVKTRGQAVAKGAAKGLLGFPPMKKNRL